VRSSKDMANPRVEIRGQYSAASPPPHPPARFVGPSGRILPFSGKDACDSLDLRDPRATIASTRSSAHWRRGMLPDASACSGRPRKVAVKVRSWKRANELVVDDFKVVLRTSQLLKPFATRSAPLMSSCSSHHLCQHGIPQISRDFLCWMPPHEVPNATEQHPDLFPRVFRVFAVCCRVS